MIIDGKLYTYNDSCNLIELCHKFIKDNRIACTEIIYQCDWVSEHSLEFIEKMCHLIGYCGYPEDK